MFFFFFSSRRRHTRCSRDWSSDVCSSDLMPVPHASQTTPPQRGSCSNSEAWQAPQATTAPPSPSSSLQLLRHLLPSRRGTSVSHDAERTSASLRVPRRASPLDPLVAQRYEQLTVLSETKLERIHRLPDWCTSQPM